MATLTLVTREEGIITPKGRRKGPKAPRSIRMAEFVGYAEHLASNPDAVAVFTDIDGDPRKFVMTLKSALKKIGIAGTVRKVRNAAEVRAWLAGASDAPDDDSDLEDAPDDDDEEEDTDDEEEEDEETAQSQLAGAAR